MSDFDIKNIAKLASINLSAEEQEKLTNDLSIILEHVQALSSLELDTNIEDVFIHCLLYTSPSPRDRQKSRMPSSA